MWTLQLSVGKELWRRKILPSEDTKCRKANAGQQFIGAHGTRPNAQHFQDSCWTSEHPSLRVSTHPHTDQLSNHIRLDPISSSQLSQRTDQLPRRAHCHFVCMWILHWYWQRGASRSKDEKALENTSWAADNLSSSLVYHFVAHALYWVTERNSEAECMESNCVSMKERLIRLLASRSGVGNQLVTRVHCGFHCGNWRHPIQGSTVQAFRSHMPVKIRVSKCETLFGRTTASDPEFWLTMPPGTRFWIGLFHRRHFDLSP